MLNKITLQTFFVFLLLLLVGWVFSGIITYVVISLVITTFLMPLTERLCRLQVFRVKIPRVAAIIIAYTLLLLLLVSFVLLFVPLISSQLQLISEIDLDEMLLTLDEPIRKLELFLINRHLTSKEAGFITMAIKQNIDYYFNSIDFGTVINNLIVITSNVFVSMLAVIFISFFLLYEKGILKRVFLSFVPNAYFELTIATIYKIETLLTNYLRGLLLQVFSIFTLTSLGLSLIGVEYAFTVALFAAVINIIPYLGPLIGSLFAIFVGFSTAQFDINGEGYLLLIIQIVSVSVIVHLIDNLFLQPLIFSKSVKAHPLEIFVAIFAGAAVGGVIGMIVAIPVYTLLRVSSTELYRGYQQYHIFRAYKKI